MEIILFGNERDDKIARDLIHTINNDYGCFYCKNKTIKNKKDPKISIYETDGKLELKDKVSAIIIKEKANINNLKNINKDIPLIFWSSNKRQKELISKYGFKGISCGLSSKDTLTYSSVGSENSVITLQRELFSHAPMEIIAKHSKRISKYSILIYAAITLFMEDSDEIEIDIKKPKITINKTKL